MFQGGKRMVDIVISSVVNTIPTPQRKSPVNDQTLKGRILAVRSGRERKRRVTDIGFNQTVTERRYKKESRKSQTIKDNHSSKIIVFRVETGNDLSNLINKEAVIRVLSA